MNGTSSEFALDAPAILCRHVPGFAGECGPFGLARWETITPRFDATQPRALRFLVTFAGINSSSLPSETIEHVKIAASTFYIPLANESPASRQARPASLLEFLHALGNV